MMVSAARKRISRVPPKLPSTIHDSLDDSLRTISTHSSSGVLSQFGRQKSLSKWITSMFRISPSLREKVDLPDPPEPMATIRFILQVCDAFGCENRRSSSEG